MLRTMLRQACLPIAAAAGTDGMTDAMEDLLDFRSSRSTLNSVLEDCFNALGADYITILVEGPRQTLFSLCEGVLAPTAPPSTTAAALSAAGLDLMLAPTPSQLVAAGALTWQPFESVLLCLAAADAADMVELLEDSYLLPPSSASGPLPSLLIAAGGLSVSSSNSSSNGFSAPSSNSSASSSSSSLSSSSIFNDSSGSASSNLALAASPQAPAAAQLASGDGPYG